MEIPDTLDCLFSATVESDDEEVYTIEVPRQEVHQGAITPGETYRVALLAADTEAASDGSPTTASDASPTSAGDDPSSPPVAPGDRRRVEIESIGDQGDGIARIERGFVVIVPDTDQGERVAVEITDVAETVAFADVVERISYYD